MSVPSTKPIIVRVRAKAAPVDGRANAALEALLAQTLGLPWHGVVITGGTRSRRKRIAVSGLSPEYVQAAIDRLEPEAR